MFFLGSKRTAVLVIENAVRFCFRKVTSVLFSNQSQYRSSNQIPFVVVDITSHRQASLIFHSGDHCLFVLRAFPSVKNEHMVRRDLAQICLTLKTVMSLGSIRIVV